MAVFSFLWDGAWAIDTYGADGTKVIAVVFIFIAYVLHTGIALIFQKVRANGAWHAIEQHETVEVTEYSVLTRIFRCRGKWDVARITTVLLGVLTLASWGLELSMGLAYYEGDADILNRPPPVMLGYDERSDDVGYWQVIPKEDFDCEERGCNTLSNIYDEYADSMYNLMATGACHAGYVSGTSRVALWSTTAEKAPSLLYYLRGDRPAVNSTKCAEETQPTQMKVYHGDDLWGSVAECTNGPELSSVRQEDDLPTVSRPTVLMTRSDGKVFVVVEETSYYPSFLYSVWTASEMLDRSIQMEHEFHIAASTRLVHAVITGIVHGEVSGKYCFKLVRMWSECGNRCGRTLSPATPFGEHVTSDTVKIENIETIGCGVESNVDTFLCIGCLLALTVVGAAWSLCRRFKGGMDVYNRDELFRAVSSSGGKAGNTPPSAIRVFVRKDHTGNVNVVITDRSNRQVIHPRIRQEGGVRLTEKAKPGPTPVRKKDGENLAEEAEPLPTTTTTRKQGRANLTQEAKLEPMAIWRQGAANLMEEGEPAPDSAVPSKCDTCSCGVVIPPGATSHGVDAQCKTCSSGTTADMPRGSRKVWVRGQRTGTARGRPDPTSNYRAFLAMNVSPVPEHFNSRKVCERRHSGSPWEKASQSFFAGECENGRTDSG